MKFQSQAEIVLACLQRPPTPTTSSVRTKYAAIAHSVHPAINLPPCMLILVFLSFSLTLLDLCCRSPSRGRDADRQGRSASGKRVEHDVCAAEHGSLHCAHECGGESTSWTGERSRRAQAHPLARTATLHSRRFGVIQPALPRNAYHAPPPSLTTRAHAYK